MRGLLPLLALLFLSFGHAASANPLWLRHSAISPDGSTIVFSYGGDLYTIPSSGGMAYPLTIHEAYDHSPVWSPDGQYIAFASDRYGNSDIYIVPAKGGNATRLTYHSAGDMPNCFSPDGSEVIFSSSRLDDFRNQQFPSGVLPELYAVPVKGGRVRQVLTVPTINAQYNSDGSKMVYHDQKGYEDDLRKHHRSSVTRDVWMYEPGSGKFTQLTDFDGEDRHPVFAPGEDAIYYLSEMDGTFNVYRMELSDRSTTQLSRHTNHPVRFLTASKDGLMCYSWDGELYLLKEGGQPQKVNVQIGTDVRYNDRRIVQVGSADDMAVSPNGKEIAFIHRGEVFVASIKEGTTKRITDTPEQERGLSFSPDGKALLYASERNKSWNLYQTKLTREGEDYFFNSTILKEEPVLESEAETFQASFSPDGKEVAFLEERTALRVINLESKAVRTIMPANRQYSYSDGDQHYQWSPDGKWFLVNFLQDKQWTDQAGLVSADGKGEIINLTKSGYGAYVPQWMMDGKMMLWLTQRDGQKNHASWGGEMDAYGTYLTQDAWDESKLSEEEYELLKEEKTKKEEEEKKAEEEKSKDKKGKDKKEEKPAIEPIKIELDGIEDRKRRLTIHSSDLSDVWVNKDGSKLFYLSSFEGGFDLWQTDLRTRETKILAKMGAQGGGMYPDKEGKTLYILAGGQINSVNVESGEMKPVSIKGEMELDEMGERAYLFEHVWRQVLKKFYVKDLHGVDWNMYKAAYARFLPHINNNYDFADMLSEMLGELNASHTGAGYRSGGPGDDQTASLGFFPDESHTGNGLKVAEVLARGPLTLNNSKIKAGVIIEKIDGVELPPSLNHNELLNRKAGHPVLLSLYDPATKQRWEETVKPIGRGEENELLYKRWVEARRKIVEEKSGGKLGYVHVRGMDDRSYRVVYDEALGRYHNKEGLVVDTRFNGGGWLHDDLATFLSGKPYITFFPREQDLGNEPIAKWKQKSVVVMSESNYSDAHMFPYTYRALKIGKLVGMPVPGTGTAVWWEGLQNGCWFGIPQVGMIDVDGDYLENKQLEPDVKVLNEPGVVSKGRDQQLEKAVEVIMQ